VTGRPSADAGRPPTRGRRRTAVRRSSRRMTRRRRHGPSVRGGPYRPRGRHDGPGAGRHGGGNRPRTRTTPRLAARGPDYIPNHTHTRPSATPRHLAPIHRPTRRTSARRCTADEVPPSPPRRRHHPPAPAAETRHRDALPPLAGTIAHTGETPTPVPRTLPHGDATAYPRDRRRPRHHAAVSRPPSTRRRRAAMTAKILGGQRRYGLLRAGRGAVCSRALRAPGGHRTPPPPCATAPPRPSIRMWLRVWTVGSTPAATPRDTAGDRDACTGSGRGDRRGQPAAARVADAARRGTGGSNGMAWGSQRPAPPSARGHRGSRRPGATGRAGRRDIPVVPVGVTLRGEATFGNNAPQLAENRRAIVARDGTCEDGEGRVQGCRRAFVATKTRLGRALPYPCPP